MTKIEALKQLASEHIAAAKALHAADYKGVPALRHMEASAYITRLIADLTEAEAQQPEPTDTNHTEA